MSASIRAGMSFTVITFILNPARPRAIYVKTRCRLTGNFSRICD